MFAKALILAALLVAAAGLAFAAVSALSAALGGALFLPSSRAAVEVMLHAAGLRPGEKIYDLGCGDGRLLVAAARRWAVQAVGVEISPLVIALAWLRVRLGGVQVRLVLGDARKVDFRDADAVFCYLMPELLERLEPRFRQLKPGCRIVCHRFGLSGWSPQATLPVPGRGGGDRVLLYRVVGDDRQAPADGKGPDARPSCAKLPWGA